MLNKASEQKLNRNDLLVEIGTEDLPAKGLETLNQAFSERIAAGLEKAELSFTKIQTFATPRRLAVIVSEVSPFQPDRVTSKRGPAKAQAYDDTGNPTEVLLRFAKACNVSPKALTLQETPKGAWLVLEQKEVGKSANLLIAGIVQEALNTLPLLKRMRWDNRDDSFIRPIHWVVLKLGNEFIPAEYFGIPSGTTTRGHRFHCPSPVEITSIDHYESLLAKTGFVIADFQKRKTAIRQQMLDICSDLNASPVLDENLLEEVTGLVEWPVVLLGKFSEEFLTLPKEVLITSLQMHQKCFAVMDKSSKLLPKFLITSNIASLDPPCVIEGNECVVSARLKDAVFFYKVDLETSLETRREDLKNVTFLQNLADIKITGKSVAADLWHKSRRIEYIAKFIAEKLGADKKIAARASELCKTDLLTNMVGEFPELQGIMGKYYALHSQEPEAVAKAIEEHYHPRFAQDTLPESLEGCAIALADRIDTLVCLFAIGKRPSGDKDPFAMKRQAFAILRILIEKKLNLNLLELIDEARAAFTGDRTLALNSDFVPELMDFCFERLRAWTLEQNITPQVFNAVLEQRPSSPYDFYRRLLAVNNFRILPEAESLAQANKRVKNILSKTVMPAGEVDISLLQEDAEKDLMAIVIDKEAETSPLMEKQQYEATLNSLAALKDPVDTFFEKVMVMCDDTKLRDNRLKLLNRLRALFLRIADISVL